MTGARDTIFALATAPGRAAVAVVRVSGPATDVALRQLSGSMPPARMASVRRLRDGAGRTLDSALVLWFPAPASYTGEDVAEMHLHGGRAVVEGVLSALGGTPGLRLAQPGEFTRRAFENGRLDLAQAEAVADLIDAETDAQRRQALDQLGGALSRRHEAWRGLLLDSLAWLEAAVDFPDEDLPEVVEARAGPGLRALEQELAAAVSDARRGERVRSGYRVALVGEPNAGKSTLLNALAGRDAAIVTPTPGTTRDVIEVPMVLAGYAVLLADTAGLRATADPIEAEGVRRATAWAEGADLRLWVVDASAAPRERPAVVQAGDLTVWNKRDLRSADAAHPEQSGDTLVCAHDAADVDRLRTLLTERVVADLSGAEFPSATRQRHHEALIEALASVRAALRLLDAPELAAEEVRRAARMLERITGRVEVEQVLGRVFASFCVGK